MITVQQVVLKDSDKWVYPFQVGVKMKWPVNIEHEGSIYWFTQKEGIGMKDGVPSAEYQNDTHNRVWLNALGQMIPE